MTDCKVSAIQVPSLIPETKFQFTIKLIAKVAGVKGSVKLLDAVIRGEYIKPWSVIKWSVRVSNNKLSILSLTSLEAAFILS